MKTALFKVGDTVFSFQFGKYCTVQQVSRCGNTWRYYNLHADGSAWWELQRYLQSKSDREKRDDGAE